MESKIINPSKESVIEKSAYQQEFLSDDRELTGIPKSTRQSRKIHDPAIAPLRELSVRTFAHLIINRSV